MKYKTNNTVSYSSQYHVVWCTKYRRTVLNEAITRRLESIIEQVCLERQAELKKVSIVPDHVRLLLDIDPQFGIHRLVKQIKATSSRLLRNEYKELRSRLPTLWTNSYLVAAVGRSPDAMINDYIEKQKYV